MRLAYEKGWSFYMAFSLGGATMGKSADLLWEKLAPAEQPQEEAHMESPTWRGGEPPANSQH